MVSSLYIIITLVAVLSAVVTAIPGVFLVLRGVSLMSDAMSHAIILGIASMFLLVQRLDSLWLFFGAVLAGLITVAGAEMLMSRDRMQRDAAIGLIFPLFFSLGVLIISIWGRHVHLDVDMVLLGEIAFSPFNRLVLWGVDYGPYALWLLSGIALFQMVSIRLFFKELVIVCFDQPLATVLGMPTTSIYWGLMMLTSITAVGVFDIVGSVVVVALMITPAAAALLIASSVEMMLVLSVLFGVVSAVSGYAFAWYWNVSIAGAIGTCCGIVFGMVWLTAPVGGLITRWYHRRYQQKQIRLMVVLACLDRNDGNAHGMSGVQLADRLGISLAHIDAVYDDAYRCDYVLKKNDKLYITSAGIAALHVYRFENLYA